LKLSNPDKVGSVLLIVLALAIGIIGVQSCSQSNMDYYDSDILQVGRERLIQSFTDPDEVQVIQEAVLRPGRRGGEFGYWARYKRLTADGSWVEEEHYDE
jgi:hypothetical protein